MRREKKGEGEQDEVEGERDIWRRSAGMERNSGGDDALRPGKHKACGQESQSAIWSPIKSQSSIYSCKIRRGRARLQLPREAYELSRVLREEARMPGAAADGSLKSHVGGASSI